MSGRIRPPSASEVTCSSKSQCSSMPAISTTRRSCSSPQRPRVCGDRSAVTRLRVSFCSWSCEVDRCFICSVRVAVGPLALHLEALHPLLVLPQLLADGLQELLDGLLTLGQLALGRLAGLVELGVGELEELLVVLLEGQGRQPGELTGQLGPRLLERRGALFASPTLVLQFGGQTGGGRLQGSDQLLLLGDSALQTLHLAGQGLVPAQGVAQPGLGGPCRRHLVRAEQQAQHDPQSNAGQKSHDEPGNHDESSSGPRGPSGPAYRGGVPPLGDPVPVNGVRHRLLGSIRWRSAAPRLVDRRQLGKHGCAGRPVRGAPGEGRAR